MSFSMKRDSRGKTTKRKVNYKQGYRKAWEEVSEFQGWLTVDANDPGRAYCRYCEKSLHAHRLSLMKHVCAIKHLKNELRFKNPTASEEEYAVCGTDEMRVQPAPVSGRSIRSVDDKPMATFPMKPKTKNSGPNETNSNEVKTEDSTLEDENEDSNEMDIYAAIEDQTDPTTEFLTFKSKEDSSYDEVEQWIEDEELVAEEEVVDYSDEMEAVPDRTNEKSPISTHILDTTRGLPAAAVHVKLFCLIDNKWMSISEGFTNLEGRFDQFLNRSEFYEGRFKIHYDVDKYFESTRTRSIYPFIEVVFDVFDANDSYHIPLLLNPFGYSTYRGC